MGIKAKAQQDVNSSNTWRFPLSGLAIFFLMHAALAAGTATAAPDPELDPTPSASTPEPKIPSPADYLPDIEAHDFEVKVSKRSTSGRTYLFDDVTDAKTRPGKILLLRRDSAPIMAFRVVKTYEDRKQLAAKRVRRYGDVDLLEAGESYMALEKVGDVQIPPPTAQDKADLKELENPNLPTAPAPLPPPSSPEVKAFDPDLDAATSPPPAGAADSEGASDGFREEDEDPDARFGASVEEVNQLDTNHQWLTGSFGYFRNGGESVTDEQGVTTRGTAFFAGGGLRYGLSLGRMILLRRAHAQDSIALEVGAFYYKILNFETNGGTFGIAPLTGTVRYNILFDENFGIFFYGGFMRNIVVTAAGSSDTNVGVLSASYPAIGAGMLFRIGPHWNARVDLGYESVSLGLTLRF